MKYFVIAAGGARSVEKIAFSTHVSNAGVAWWHWIDELWLISDPREEVTATGWRNKATQFMKTADVIALEVQPKDWAAAAPKSANDWMSTNWSSLGGLLQSLLSPPKN